MVYGILEKNRNWSISSSYLNTHYNPVKLFAYGIKDNFLINAVYGIPCKILNGYVCLDDNNKKIITDLYKKITETGKMVELGFFNVISGNFYVHQKEYILEESEESAEIIYY